MFTSPGAIAIQTPYFNIYWYGIILAIAFLTALFIVVNIAKNEYSEDKKIPDTFYDIGFWVLLGGIFGARLYYVLLSPNYYLSNLKEIFMIQHGGLSIHGAVLGGIIAGAILCKIKKMDFFKYADLCALGLPIAQAIGRWGNFFNSEAFGLPTNLPWGIFIPENARPTMYASFEYFHPTFLYECIWNILVFLILFFVIKKFFFKCHGIAFFAYLILYSLGRIAIEFIRIDSVLNILGISIAVWASILTIIISIIFIIFISKKNNIK